MLTRFVTSLRNCFLKHVIEGKITVITEVTGTQGRRGKQLLDGVKEKRGSWKLNRTVWRT